MLEALQAAPEGHDAAVAALCGCTAREALTGPMPPGWGVMAMIAGPMLEDAPPWQELASAMADSGHSEWAWRDALLPFFPEVIDELGSI